MADFNALEALINAYIKQNGVQAITGQVLNGVLRGMVSALGKGWTVAGEAYPNTDPGTMTGPVAYVAHAAGTYTNFGGLVVNDGEVAFLKYNEQTWTKEVLASLAATASVDGNVGTPYVVTQFVNGVLNFAFHNMKGDPGINGTDGQDGAAAGFGTVNATVDGNVGTPGVSVQSSGPDTAKNFTFQFTNLKGETGVTSVVVTVDNTSGNPQCTASLNAGVLTLAFTGLKGDQGDTGSSVDYPFTLVNNLTTNDATQALTAAMGVQLESEITQLEAQVSDMAIPGNVRQAIASVLENVAFANDDGYSSELAIIRAWADNLVLVSIDAVFTQGGNNIYATDSLDKLKQYLVVTANYDDSSSAVLGDNDYTLSGTLTVGTSTITVTYQGKTDTFTVTVSASPFLYVLPSTFTSDGDSVVDTGFMPEKNKTYTILCESTESTESSAAVFIYGNRKSHGATNYIGLTSQTSKVWGMGITYSSRISAAQNLLRTAVVMVVDGDGKASCDMSAKIGTGTILTRNNSYNFDTTDSSIVNNLMLGDCTNHGDDGFLGSVTYFAIYDGEMPAADITDFLNDGAS